MTEPIVDKRGYPTPGFLDLFSRRDELQIRQIELLRQILANLQCIRTTPTIPGAPPIIERSGPGLRTVRTVLFDHLRPYNASFTYYPTFDLVDCSEALESILLVVMSTCDVAVTVQAIGALGPQAASVGAIAIGPSESLGATSRIGLGIDLSVNLYPYIGY